MADASVRAYERDGRELAARVSSVTGGSDPDPSTTTAAFDAGHNHRLGLTNRPLGCDICDLPLPISVTHAGHEALRRSLQEEAEQLECQHELGVIRGQLECLNCGQLKVSFGSGRAPYRDKRS